MTTGIFVKDAMIKDIVKAKPADSIKQIAILMKEKDVGSIVICDNNKLSGIVTREDIIDKVVAADKSASKIFAKDIMTVNVITVKPEDDLADAARKMSKYGFERLPVLSNGKIVGLISDREIAKVAPGAIEILRERLMLDEGDDIGEDVHTDEQEGDCELCGNHRELEEVNGKWVCETCKEEAAEI